MFEFTDLRDELALYLNEEQVTAVANAYLYAAKAHEGQKRRTGEDYITHPLAVARILCDMRMDHESIMAAMLHDVLEDTKTSKTMLSTQFGPAVAELVDGVSKLTQVKFENRAEAQAENFRKMLLAMSRDIRVILVKLADRLHNMRTLGVMPVEKRRRIARETLEIYAPIANRLGMNNFRIEFEDLGFSTLFPLRSRTLKECIRKARGNRKEIMRMIETTLRQGLQKRSFPPDAVRGREKHLYSIYKKMRDRHVPFSQIMDFYAFRILVDDADSCYQALGLIHQLYKPVPGRFKDYIAIPKANGYQSVHTTLFGPYGVPIEIQIRTHEMHHMAEQGIAAHWLYKTPESSITQAQASARTWLKNLLDMQKSAGNSIEFMQNVKMDLFPDEVYVFTPKGDIMELPAGATVIDFAYAVHTDVGNHCVAARVDRQIAPLSTLLENGQTIEIEQEAQGAPNPAWLSFVVSSKARSNIRHFFKNQQRAESIILGQRLLNAALADHQLSREALAPRAVEHLLHELSLQSFDELLADIGMGNRTSVLVARRLHELQGAKLTTQTLPTPSTTSPLLIKGTEGMMINFATCCWPIPGDPIVGVVGKGQGLTIHIEGCQHLKAIRRQTEKFVPVCWEDQMSNTFQVKLFIETLNQRGVLATITAMIAESANINSIHSQDKDERYSLVTLILSVRDRVHLAHIMRRLRSIKTITKIMRAH